MISRLKYRFGFKAAVCAAMALSVFVPATGFAGPIYVYREADGSIRFTNKTPPPGVKAKVFTASKPNFSVYSVKNGYKSSYLFKKRYKEIISKVATTHKLDPHLIQAVIHVESAFNSQAVSPKGAQGLMQLMPGTARMLGVKNPFMPEQNIDGGTRHLARLVVKYNGNLKLALAAYNAGEEPVDRYKGVPPYSETQMYVRRVLELKERYRSSTYG